MRPVCTYLLQHMLQQQSMNISTMASEPNRGAIRADTRAQSWSQPVVKPLISEYSKHSPPSREKRKSPIVKSLLVTNSHDPAAKQERTTGTINHP
mmetsp:Transcript_23111/g.55731  ORF Transcript_23111/g.55731 Transcript_23111/m.55731 type:complete len:95 (+) Transcript_23111:973-1257(+)